MTQEPPTTAIESPSGTDSESLPPWPVRGRALAELFGAYLALVAVGLGIGWLLLGPMAGTALLDFDDDVAAWLATNRTPALDELTDLGSALADTFNIVGALVVLMIAFTWSWKRWRESLTLGFALALEALVFLTVSLSIGRDRPPVEQLDISPATASFPSGHTGAAFAFYITLALIVFWNTKKTLPRLGALLGAIILPSSVGVSRLYRGMHYLTDVVIGAGLGIACVAIAAYIVKRAITRTENSQ